MSITLILGILLGGCGPKNKDSRTWSVYKADAGSSGFSPLDQISTTNAASLKPAWSFDFEDAEEGARSGRSECNPIIIDGIMYVTSARHRVYAIDAGSGKLRWSFDPFDGGPGGGVSRGVTYWENARDKRILFTAGDNLYALNAETGKIIPDFGVGGKVSMNIGIRDDPKAISIKPTSPGIIYQNLIIMGQEVSELYGAQPGYVRAYNVVSGKLEWTFHTIPKPGELGYETWPKDAWKTAGGANDWGGMSADLKRGMVFIATGSPTYDFYGADRKGTGLFGNSIVALDAKTGKHIWHFQTIHHDLWDYDLPCPPNLITIQRNGKTVDAVAQVSKVGFTYVLDRETGTPLFPIEERKVPASDIPGEQAWPTQPYPSKPAPFSRQFMTRNDLSNFSEAGHDTLLKKFDALRYEGLFTPPSTKGTLNLPGTVGGAEWGGAAVDPSTGILYVKSNDLPEIDFLQKIDPSLASPKHSGFRQGRIFYKTYCISCHKADRNGQEPFYPSLVNVDKRLKKDEVLNRIRTGGGKMPPFASVIKGNEEAIIAFLFQIRDEKSDQKEADMSEIKSNLVAKKDTGLLAKNDSARIYLNLLAYASFEDQDGHPAIKPPWGTLNAINLNTGEYEWKVPVGNIPSGQTKGGPETGSESSTGPMVTAGGLVFVAGTRDKKFKAFDKKTGKLVWEYTLPGLGSSNPSSYSVNGRQYIAISVGGSKDKPAGRIMTFALSEN